MPLPADEPALPPPHEAVAPPEAATSHEADPSRLVTGPGLEPMSEPEMPKGMRA